MNIDLVLEDMLDEDFVKIFQPINAIQNFMGYLRVNIKYRFPKAPSTFLKLYSVALWITIIYLFCDSLQSFKDFANVETVWQVGAIIIVVLSAALVWITNFTKEDLNSQFFVKLQKIDRYLCMPNVKDINRKTFKSSLVSSVLFTLLFINHILFCSYKLSLIQVIVSYIELGIFIEMILVFYILLFITVRIEYIYRIVEKVGSNETAIFNKRLWFFFEISTLDKKVEFGSRVVLCVRSVLEVIQDFVKLFQFSIFVFTTKILIWSFVLIQTIIIAMKDKNSFELLTVVTVTSTLFLMLVIQIILCLIAEDLMTKLRQLKTLCVNMFCNEGLIRENSRKILLLLENDNCINIFDMYCLDTKLPLHLFAITTSYTVVLLQFALL